MHQWLRDSLVCPRHKRQLKDEGNYLVCPDGERFLVVDDIPVLLPNDGVPTHGYIDRTFEQVARIEAGEPIEDVIAWFDGGSGPIDEYVRRELPYTCGHLYFALQESASRYPFPEIRLGEGEGKILLDVGCNWGRWTIPAAKKGYRSIGIDPSLDAVFAARRIARKLGADAQFVVGDARFLPFADDSIDVGFSYSVIQHFKRSNVKLTLGEIARVTRSGGQVLVQMPNKYGLRCLYHQARMGFKEGREGPDVFYWTPRELDKEFSRQFGKTEVSVDCFFGLNLQAADLDMMPFTHRVAIRFSEILRSASKRFSPIVKVADSLYLRSLNQKN